jgi:hypothetical protein
LITDCERLGVLTERLERERMEIVVMSLITEEVNQTSLRGGTQIPASLAKE